jgi:hypothetical protein
MKSRFLAPEFRRTRVVGLINCTKLAWRNITPIITQKTLNLKQLLISTFLRTSQPFNILPLMEQELLTLPEHLSWHPVFSEVRVNISSFLCNVLQIVACSYVLFLFGNCVVCPSAIYGFWLPLWYLQTLFIPTSLSQWLLFNSPSSLKYNMYVFDSLKRVRIY